MYHVVVQTVKESIQRWFTDNGKPFDVDKIAWVITVPAIARLEQKEFMTQVFKYGMGQFNGKPIPDARIQCVLEPEGGFLFAL